jgi:hypothetical protein
MRMILTRVWKTLPVGGLRKGQKLYRLSCLGQADSLRVCDHIAVSDYAQNFVHVV